MLKKILLGAGAILLLLLIAVFTIPFLIPKSVYRAKIESAATQALGRAVTLEGDVGLSVFPAIAARVEDVSIANPEGFSRPDMVRAGALRGSLRWLPLLTGKVEIGEIAFVDADVALEVRRDGTNNWTLGTDAAEAPAGDPASSSGGLSASIGQARLDNARLSFTDATSGASYVLDGLDATASLRGMDDLFTLSAKGRLNDTGFTLKARIDNPQALMGATGSAVAADLESPLGSLGWQGEMALASGTLNGALSADRLDIAGLSGFLGDASGDLAAFARLAGRVDLRAKVSGTLTAPVIQIESLSQQGEGVSGKASGLLVLGEKPALSDGKLRVNVTDARPLAVLVGLDDTLAGALGEMSIETDASGPLSALTLANLRLRQTSELSELNFAGSATFGAQPRLQGGLSARTGDIAGLIQAATGSASALAPQPFQLEAGLDGSASSLALSGLKLGLGESTLGGDLRLTLGGPRPRLTGALSGERLVLDTVLAPAEPAAAPSTPAQGGWSDTPLPFPMLKLADAQLSLSLGELRMDRLDVRDVKGDVGLSNGRLDLTGLSLNGFGGSLTGTAGLDASGQTPRLSLALSGQSLQIADITRTFASLSPMTGSGTLTIDLDASGASARALMGSLAGNGAIALKDGAIKGVNLGQLLRSAEQALKTGTLPATLSPGEETDFTTLSASLPIANGQLRIADFRLLAPLVRADGEGVIDLGQQTLDVRLFPRAVGDTQGQGGEFGVEGYGLPIRLSGSWSSPSASLDTAWLAKKAQDAALEEVGDRIGDTLDEELGSELGVALGDALGIPRKPPATPASPDGSQDAAPAPDAPASGEEAPKSVEEQLKEDALKRLGGILGGD